MFDLLQSHKWPYKGHPYGSNTQRIGLILMFEKYVIWYNFRYKMQENSLCRESNQLAVD